MRAARHCAGRRGFPGPFRGRSRAGWASRHPPASRANFSTSAMTSSAEEFVMREAVGCLHHEGVGLWGRENPPRQPLRSLKSPVYSRDPLSSRTEAVPSRGHDRPGRASPPRSRSCAFRRRAGCPLPDIAAHAACIRRAVGAVHKRWRWRPVWSLWACETTAGRRKPWVQPEIGSRQVQPLAIFDGNHGSASGV